MGFNIEATSGTAAFLRKNGIRTRVKKKISEQSEEIFQSIRQGYVNYVINTRDYCSGGATESDGLLIRRCAVENGVTIFTALETTGDGQVTALQFLQVLAQSGKKASELASVCAAYPQVLINVEVPHSGGVKEKIMASQELAEAVEKQEAALNREGRVLVRASGTEALIRVMVEAKTTEIAHNTADFLVSLIKSLKF